MAEQTPAFYFSDFLKLHENSDSDLGFFFFKKHRITKTKAKIGKNDNRNVNQVSEGRKQMG